MKSDAVAQTVDTKQSISFTVGELCKVKYSFLVEKGGKLFRFYLQCALKLILRNIFSHFWIMPCKTIICFMILFKHGSSKEISVKFFLSQILLVEESINGKIKYENFMIYVQLEFYFEFNLLGYCIFFKYLIFVLANIDLFSMLLHCVLSGTIACDYHIGASLGDLSNNIWVKW